MRMLMIIAAAAGLVLLLSATHVSEGRRTNHHHEHQVRCIERERFALIAFKQGLDDPGNFLSSWTNNTNQLECCTWTGIRCDELTNHVIMLDLKDDMLGGEIGPSLLELKHVEYLDFSGNYFTKIPNFIDSLKSLIYLDLTVNGAIPSHLGNLTKLQFLKLGSGGDQLIVDNLEWLSHLHSLRSLKFYGPYFTKSGLQSFHLPPSLASLEFQFCQFPQVDISSLSYANSSNSLTSLAMFYNTVHSTTISWLLNSSSNLVDLRLSNSIIGAPNPFQLGKLSKLKFLDLDAQMIGNSLEWLSHLSSLKYFKLHSSNSTSVGVQSFKIPPSLSTLKLSYCQLLETDGNSSSSLTALEMHENTIHSTVLTLLLNSSANLVNLTMYHNSLVGSLPNSFQKMNSLEHVQISFNDGLANQIPKSMGNVTNLQTLDLSSSNLTGTLQEILEDDKTFPSLRKLDLSYNLLEGSFPNSSSQFPKLVVFHLSGNRLTGPLAESNGELHNLESFDISENSLFGIVSEIHFSKLSNLRNLDLSSNSLTLSFNSNWVPPFRLTSLSLRSCKLGRQFPSWLHNQLNLSDLDISNSGISNVIPSWFCNMTIKLESLDLSSNQLHGSIPPCLSNAVDLTLSGNKFSGVKSFLCDQTDVATRVLDLSNNQFFGRLPACWWNFKDLAILILENNQFSGLIPGSISLLYQIAHLSLRHNNFSGRFPSELKNCTYLQVLDVEGNNLEGEIPNWIGESLTNLVFLRLKSNRFNGSIPPNICNLQSLQIMDFSTNNISGVIPSCIDNFTSMVQVPGERYNYISVSFPLSDAAVSVQTTTAFIVWKGVEYKYEEILGLLRIIDLSSNRLTGGIPKEMENLAELLQLNLSRNNLSGAMPTKIGKLSRLEVLDLSHNKLSGKIPVSLAEASTLSYLDLSNNKLSGRIPTSTQLQSFNASVYAGNPELCGQPLTPACPGDETSEVPPNSDESYDDDDDDNGEWFDMSWLRMGICVGFAVGFCGVCGNLLLITTSRLAYFRFLDSMGDWLYVVIAVKWATFKRRFST